MGMNVGYLTCNKTTAGDECYTPFYAIDPILKYLPKDKIIWCGFDEEWSSFYQTLVKGGYKVVRSSLQEGQDFFKYEPNEWDIFVSNPPFSKKDEVLKRLYDLGKPFMLLLPMNSLQGQKRFKYFQKGIQLLCFDKRICFHTNNDYQNFKKGNHFASAYFCKDILPGDLIIEELKVYDRSLKSVE